MKISFKVIVATLGIMGLSTQAQALTISPLTPGCEVSPVCLALTGNQTATPLILVEIQNAYGPGLVEGYKQDFGGGEFGLGAPHYTTTFSNSNSDPSNATIAWNGGSALFFTTNPLYLLVKDGNQAPAWYLFKLTGWDGKESLVMENFWPQQGAISHVAIYGNPGTPGFFCTNCATVPDGGSMTVLLGMGLMGLAALRRKL